MTASDHIAQAIRDIAKEASSEVAEAVEQGVDQDDALEAIACLNGIARLTAQMPPEEAKAMLMEDLDEEERAMIMEKLEDRGVIL